jgi:thymidylate synthase (FAD)
MVEAGCQKQCENKKSREEVSYAKKVFLEDKMGFVELMDVFGSDLTVANAARVSFNKESCFEEVDDEISGKVVGKKLKKQDAALIKYLAEHRHDSPFFHPILRFRIKMPIFVVREWYRHVIGFTRNEVSRRYVTFAPEFFIPSKLRQRHSNLKQGSKSDVVDNNTKLKNEMNLYCKAAVDYYNQLLETENVCPEQARMILPQSMYTEFVETASLAGYARLVRLRVEKSAQKEIQEYAQRVSKLVEKHFPVSWQALTNSKI